MYGTSIAYGVGLGVWFDAEVGVEDAGVAMIAPILLGVAAPVGVYFLDDPEMPPGMPATIAAGMAIGAGEGLGIASYQFVTADEEDAWGFRGLARSVSLGSTLGAVGGYLLAYYEEPSPNAAAFVSSGVVWGSTIGSMFGYGASSGEHDYGTANDQASLGGLIGFNVGLAATAALSMVYEPSWDSLAWMWAGAGIGAAAGLPMFLFYLGDSTPPTRRGFAYMGGGATLGLALAAVFTTDASDFGEGPHKPHYAENKRLELDYIGPMVVPGGGGVELMGRLF